MIPYAPVKSNGAGFARSRCAGINGKRFSITSFIIPSTSNWSWLSPLPTLINILTGDMSWVGPAPKSPAEIDELGDLGRKRLLVRPGLVCRWRIQQKGNVAYRSEPEIASEYADSNSLLSDIGILVRALIVGTYSASKDQRPPSEFELLGQRINNVTMDEAVTAITDCLHRGVPSQVSFVNAHCFNVLRRSPEYVKSLADSDLVFADGIGVKIAGQLLGCPIRQNVNGTDLFPILCSVLNTKGTRIYLLGGRPGVAENVSSWISARYPNIAVCGTHHGYDLDRHTPGIVKHIQASDADCVLVGLGVPIQECWIHKHLTHLNTKVAIGVGGLFDYYSGRIPRAPLWIREIGIEWLFRLVQEPRRLFTRYVVGNLTFLFFVLRFRAQRAAIDVEF